MAPRFLDTNLFVALFTNAHEERNTRALRLFERIVGGEEEAETTLVVLFELAFLLQRTFRVPRPLVATYIERTLSTPGIAIQDRKLLFEALDIYRNTGGLSFTDAYNAAYMRRRGISEVYTWDTDFDRVEGLRRLEPA
jgi:predicted nucleic acid-binding protein